jgi:hypothetical protein
MGIFPIIMNIVQFWLIDSIVKASAIAQDVESIHQDRDPLFSAPIEDDNEQPPTLQTVNCGSSRGSVSSLDPRDLQPHVDTSCHTTVIIPDGQRSGTSSPQRLADAYYGYPPSPSSSISSDRSLTIIKETRNIKISPSSNILQPLLPNHIS